MQHLIVQFTQVWDRSFIGTTVGQLAVAAIVFLVFILARRLFARVVIARLKFLTSRTKTEIDDEIVAALQQPLAFLFLIFGLSVVVQWITFNVETEDVLIKILKSLIAFTIFWTGFRLVDPISLYFDKFLKRVAGPVANEVRDYLLKALKIFLAGSGIVAVLAQWGINPWPYFAGIGVLSLPFAFAAKDTVSNLFGGIKLILVDQVFGVGDWIETRSIGHGTVESITLSTIKVRKFSKAILTVPNGIVANEPITNWTRMTNRRIKMDIGLTYGTTSDQFRKILDRIREFIADDDRVDHGVTEMVHMTGFNSSSVDINLYYFTKTTDWKEWRQIMEEHMLAFLGIIEEEGSAIAFPTRTIHVEGAAGEIK
ncbi:MAG: mechanosensitive ion channel family protein [Rhodospirillales bacterium]|nr:mechanosensitive ion channel family protein [Rhodospirillales bacterium]